MTTVRPLHYPVSILQQQCPYITQYQYYNSNPSTLPSINITTAMPLHYPLLSTISSYNLQLVKSLQSLLQPAVSFKSRSCMCPDTVFWCVMTFESALLQPRHMHTVHCAAAHTHTHTHLLHSWYYTVTCSIPSRDQHCLSPPEHSDLSQAHTIHPSNS